MSILTKKYPLFTGATNPVLRAKSAPVAKLTKELKQFWKDLLELMYEYEGAGLAAPQVGANIRMIAVSFWKEGEKKMKKIWETIMVNPHIISKSDKMIVSEEACLSLPKLTWDVLRHETIKVTWEDLAGKKHSEKLSGYNAIVVQHEVDHLDGVLYIDKLIK